MIRTIKQYAIDIIIGALIVYFLGIKWFLLFLLIELFIVVDLVRKLVRVFHMNNQVKIIAILNKLKITDKEIKEAVDEVKNKDPEGWESVEKDLREII